MIYTKDKDEVYTDNGTKVFIEFCRWLKFDIETKFFDQEMKEGLSVCQ